MTITVDIRPEVEAELIRQATARGRAIEAHAATLLEDAVHLQAEPAPVRTGQALIDACAKVRGLEGRTTFFKWILPKVLPIRRLLAW